MNELFLPRGTSNTGRIVIGDDGRLRFEPPDDAEILEEVSRAHVRYSERMNAQLCLVLREEDALKRQGLPESPALRRHRAKLARCRSPIYSAIYYRAWLRRARRASRPTRPASCSRSPRSRRSTRLGCRVARRRTASRGDPPGPEPPPLNGGLGAPAARHSALKARRRSDPFLAPHERCVTGASP